MSLTTSEMTPADIAAVTNGNDGFGSGNNAWWIILFLFALGWGGFGGYGNGGGQSVYDTNAYVQRGFDQNAVMSGINNLTTATSNGFANAEVSRCNGNTNVLQAINNAQSSITQGANTLAMSLQNCCCENRLGLANLGADIAREACADRAAVSDGIRDVLTAQTAGIQRILDTMCQDKIDAKNERIADLERQLTMANLAASQNAQTASIIANNEAQTAALENYLNPPARPAYIVQNPNCCAPFAGCGCGAV